MLLSQYKDLMEADGWSFHSMYDVLCANRYFGRKDQYSCYIDLSHPTIVDNEHIFFWETGFDWEFNAPEEYSFQNVIRNSLVCDCCRALQFSTDNLIHVNTLNKWCVDCVEDGNGIVYE